MALDLDQFDEITEHRPGRVEPEPESLAVGDAFARLPGDE
jgi:hypothetical protein